MTFLDSVFTVLIATLFAVSGLIANVLWLATLPFWWFKRKGLAEHYKHILIKHYKILFIVKGSLIKAPRSISIFIIILDHCKKMGQNFDRYILKTNFCVSE